MTGFIFNIDGGYLEGLCRGFKCGILKQTDYLNLVQCETLEGEQFLRTLMKIRDKYDPRLDPSLSLQTHDLDFNTFVIFYRKYNFCKNFNGHMINTLP